MNYLHARFPFIACESYADFEQNIRIVNRKASASSYSKYHLQ